MQNSIFDRCYDAVSSSQDKSIAIRTADKGNTIVIQDLTHYLETGHKHLSNTSIYQQLPT